MATIVLFHSAYGLRPVELDAAERLRGQGHGVLTPDLYDGRVAGTVEEGMAIRDEIGWTRLCERAGRAVAELPADTVLGGFSLGAGIAASLWPSRPQTSAVLLLHGITDIPTKVRDGIPVQLHLADPDPFEPADEVAAWRAAMGRLPVRLEAFRYPGAGHLFADETLADYDAAAAVLMWERVDRLLAAL